MARQPEPWFRKGRGWYAQVGGRQVKLAPASASRQDAWQVLYRLMAENPEIGKPAAKRDLKLSEACNAFLAHSAVIHGDGTYETHRSRLETICDLFGGVAVSALRPSLFERWLAKVDRSASTKNGYIRSLKAALRWCRDEKLIPAEDPLAKLRTPKGTRREVILTREEIGRLIAAADPATADLLLALSESGARPHVVCALEARDIDWKAGVARGQSKGKLYEIVMSTRLQSRLEELARLRPSGPLLLTPRGRPWSRERTSSAFRKLGTKTGITCTPYALRHSYITNALEQGANPAAVAALVNHSDLRMISAVYNHLGQRRDALRQAAECASGVAPKDSDGGAPSA